MDERVVETRTCRACGSPFEVTDADMAFYEGVSPTFGGKKYLVPVPTRCPECRAKNILSLRNERNLYKTVCSATKREIVSIHSPDHTFPVYDQKYWWSDGWNALDYGVDFDFSRPFFEQFRVVYDCVPKINLNSPMSQNSDFTNQCQGNKDCYLCFCSGNNENCYFGMWNQDCVYCSDCLYIEHCEHCHDLVNAVGCHSCYTSTNLENCYHVHLSRNLINCKNCVGCINLDSREYCIYNQSYSKEEYTKRVGNMHLESYGALEGQRAMFHEFAKTFPVKYYNGKHNERTTGDYLQNNKAAFDCFNCRDNEDTHHCRDSWRAVQSVDLVETLSMDHCLAVEGTGFANGCLFSMKLNIATAVLYSSHCNSSSHLF